MTQRQSWLCFIFVQVEITHSFFYQKLEDIIIVMNHYKPHFVKLSNETTVFPENFTLPGTLDLIKQMNEIWLMTFKITDFKRCLKLYVHYKLRWNFSPVIFHVFNSMQTTSISKIIHQQNWTQAIHMN